MARTLGVATSKADIDEGAIAGVTIDNSVIGGTMAAAATFTDVTATGNTALGNAASDTIGMYGATPVVQRATAASHTTIATTVAISTTTGSVTSWGFSTSTQANALTAAVAELQATMVALGIWAA